MENSRSSHPDRAGGPVRHTNTVSGFTLVELLVVIAIIGILVALLLPAVQAARDAARRTSCVNKLKQIALAIQLYHDSAGVLPISISPWREGRNYSRELNGKGWIVGVLPYLEEQALYDQFEKYGFDGEMFSGGGIASPELVTVMQTQLEALQCPADASAQVISDQQYQWGGKFVALTSYKGVIGDTRMGGGSSIHQGTQPDCHNTTGCNGIFYRNNYQEPIPLRKIIDGTSHTLMVGEDIPAHNWHSTAFYSNGDYASCHAPLNFKPFPPIPEQWWNVMSFRSEHPGGGHFAMADTSVQFISQDIDYLLYRALSTKAGDETVSSP